MLGYGASRPGVDRRTVIEGIELGQEQADGVEVVVARVRLVSGVAGSVWPLRGLGRPGITVVTVDAPLAGPGSGHGAGDAGGRRTRG